MAHCPECGSEVPVGARFCQNCGADLASPQGALPAPAIETAPPLAPPIPYSVPPAPYPPLASPPIYPMPPYPIVPGQPYGPTKSGKAIAGFWLGIVSFMPGMFLSWVGILIGIVGLIFSILGRSEARQRASIPGQPRADFGQTQAMIGIVFSILGIIASTIFLVYILNNLDKYGIHLTR